MPRFVTWCSALVLVLAASQSAARAQEQEHEQEPRTRPALGGHWGAFVQLATFHTNGGANDDHAQLIGADYVSAGIVPGVAIHLDPQWTIDLEFVAFSTWDRGRDGAADTVSSRFVLDPGVVFDTGPLAIGLRTAVRVGGPEMDVGLIPIVNKVIPIGDGLGWYIEADFPIFLSHENHETDLSLTLAAQSGLAF